MTPLRLTLRQVSLANRYFGYIATIILTDYFKADLVKQIYTTRLDQQMKIMIGKQLDD